MKTKINNNYKISIAGINEWIDFAVPSSAMESFLSAGKIKDPYIGTNEYEVREFLRNDFTVKTEFALDKDTLEKKHKDLVLSGIDTLCDVFFNGVRIGTCENMHITYRFDVSKLIKNENILVFEFKSAITSVENMESDEDRKIDMINTGTMYGSHAIRKAHSMYGWDWGPQLPDCGIYNEVFLESYDEIRLDRIYVRQEHDVCLDRVVLSVIPEGYGLENANIRVKVTSPDGKNCYTSNDPGFIVIPEPELWWPYGYGKQPLYKVEVVAGIAGCEACLDSESYRIEELIGIRSLTVSRNEDQWGKEFAFICNGVKIFARGADLIPDDCFYGRITDEIIERDIKAAKFANFNCLRVWGGGYYPKDKFYEVCDREGILIWQDFMFACNVYDLTLKLKNGSGENFENLIRVEAEDVLKRLRNHACLALMCGNNEMELAWIEWEVTKYHSETLKKDYTKQFEEILPSICKKLAPDTFYWPSSPSTKGGFFDPDNENDGDSHYWMVWHGMKPFTDYRNHYFRFCSEFGFQSFPSMKTLRTFAFDKDDFRLDSQIMESHQKNPSANEKILAYLKEYFNEPANFEELVLLSQVMQGVAMKTAVDHMRRNRGRCMGSLYWQFNDNWPVASWASMDYYGRYKVLHYMARRFYAPLAISIIVNGSKCEFWVSNETWDRVEAKCKVKLKKIDFTPLYINEFEVAVDSFSSTKVFEIDFEKVLGGENIINETVSMRDVFVEFDFGEMSEWETFVPIKDINLENPCMKVVVDDDSTFVKVSAERFVPFVVLEGKNRDLIFEDNAFAILDENIKEVGVIKGRCL